MLQWYAGMAISVKSSKHVPKKLQAVLWSVDVNHLDRKRDKRYIIHQILSYGRIEEIVWLFRTYKREEIKDVFLRHPSKIYPRDIYYFTKNFLLNLKGERLPEGAYVTAISGPIEPRAARGI